MTLRMGRASAALAIAAAMAGAAACALDSRGAATSESEPLDGGAGVVKDSGIRLDATPMPASDGSALDDASTEDAPAIPTPDAATTDTGPAPLCASTPKRLSLWLHGGLAYDDTLKAGALTPRGGAVTQTEPDGGVSWVLKGGEDALQYGSTATVVDDSYHLTIEGFIAPTTVGINSRIVDRSLPNQPETGWGFDILTGGILRTYYGPFTAPFHYAQTVSGAVHAGAWQHVAGIINVTSADAGPMASVSITLYIDGVQQAPDPSLGPNGGHFADARPIPPGTLPLTFGGSPAANANLGLVGHLGDAALWKRALSAEEIKRIATGGALVRCAL